MEVKLVESTSPNQRETSPQGDSEFVLNIIAKIILYGGLISAVVLFFKGLADNTYKDDGYLLMIISPCVLFLSVITWGVLKVLCNISNNLHEINSKTK